MAVAGVLALPARAEDPCERIEITAPRAGAHLDTPKPEIRWSGDPQGTYRLQVAVVLPEGQVLQSVDTQVVGTRWALGALVPVALAAIKVVVSRHCGHYTVQDLHAAPPHFFYDARAHCAIEPQSLVQVENTLRWRASAGASRFAVTLFGALADRSGSPALHRPDDGGSLIEPRRLDRFETSEPAWDLGKLFSVQAAHRAFAPSNVLVAVQAQCGALWSQPSATILKPQQPW
jgi:hypothetical protein